LSQRTPEVDPDPFSIAAVALAAASLVLQFVQTAKQLADSPSRRPRTRGDGRALRSLERAANTVELRLARFDPDYSHRAWIELRELADSPLRIAETSLQLHVEVHQQFERDLTATFAALATLSRRINSMIRDQPELAARLGGRMSRPLSETAMLLNEAMRSGRSIGEVLRLTRTALSELAHAIEGELLSGPL
jgi:hypothetical protein